MHHTTTNSSLTRRVRAEVRLELAARVSELPLVQVDVGLGADERVVEQVFGRGAQPGVLRQAPVEDLLGGLVGGWLGGWLDASGEGGGA
jgi:hypothetical protein